MATLEEEKHCLLQEKHSFNYDRTGQANSLSLKMSQTTKIVTIKELQFRTQMHFAEPGRARAWVNVPLHFIYFFFTKATKTDGSWLIGGTKLSMVYQKGSLSYIASWKVEFQFFIPPAPPLLSGVDLTSKSLVTPKNSPTLGSVSWDKLRQRR